MGVGLPSEQATLLGQSDLTTVVAAGTTQATAKGIGASAAVITSAAGATGVVLPLTATLTRLFFIRNSSASTAAMTVYPPLGGNFNGGTTNAGLLVPAGQSVEVFRQSQTDWVAYSTSGSTNGTPAPAGQMASARTVAVGGLVPAISTDFTDATPVATEFYIGEMLLPFNSTVTGLAVFNGSVASGNVKVGLADSTGAIVATSASTAMAGTDAYQRTPFTAPASLLGGTYYALLFIDNATARYNAPPLGSFGAAKVTGQVFATGFVAITPPTTFVTNPAPIASMY